MSIKLVGASHWRRLLGISIAVGFFSNICFGTNIKSVAPIPSNSKGDFEAQSIGTYFFAYSPNFTTPNGFTFSEGTGITNFVFLFMFIVNKILKI